MKFTLSAVAAGCVLVLSGCVSASPEAQKVRIVRSGDEVKACEYLGSVKARSGFRNLAGAIANHNVQSAMQEDAHRLGGNVLLVIAIGGSKGKGRVYRCPSDVPEVKR